MDRSCRFDGKSVIVTGAGMGIGKGTAVAFAREGGCVIVADISAKSADNTVREITSQGGKAISVTCDVADSDDRSRLTRSTRPSSRRNSGLSHERPDWPALCVLVVIRIADSSP